MDVALLQSKQYKTDLAKSLSGSAGFDKELFDAIDASLNPEEGGGFEAVAAATPEKAAGMPDAAKDQLAAFLDSLGPRGGSRPLWLAIGRLQQIEEARIARCRRSFPAAWARFRKAVS